MIDDSEDVELNLAKLDIHNRKYFLLSLIFTFVFSCLAMWIAQSYGLDAKYWWPLFAAIPFSIACWIAAFLAKKRYNYLKLNVSNESKGLKRAHYISVRADCVARIFIAFPTLVLLYPIALPVFHIKLTTYMSILFAIIHTWAGQAGDKKALKQTGYSPNIKLMSSPSSLNN